MAPLKTKPVVLLAEDDEDDYLLIKDIFDDLKNPVELRWVKDGEELLEALRTHPQKPHVILLDLNMPRKDGREALKEIKSSLEWRRIPVIVLTTSRAPEDILKTHDLGANSFIRKPVGFEPFVEMVKTFEKYWFGTVELPGSV